MEENPESTLDSSSCMSGTGAEAWGDGTSVPCWEEVSSSLLLTPSVAYRPTRPGLPPPVPRRDEPSADLPLEELTSKEPVGDFLELLLLEDEEDEEEEVVVVVVVVVVADGGGRVSWNNCSARRCC